MLQSYGEFRENGVDGLPEKRKSFSFLIHYKLYASFNLNNPTKTLQRLITAGFIINRKPVDKI
jgi:hypothetical protein